MGDDKVIELNDLAWTPEFTLHRLVDFSDAIEDLAVVMKLKDGSLATALSSMRPETLAVLTKQLELTLNSCFKEADDDGDYW